MTNWFANLRSSSESRDVATYKAIRAASQSWFKKIMLHPVARRFDPVKAAKRVGIPVQNGAVIFDEENDSAVLMDYLLIDYRPDGKSLVESCVFPADELTPLEIEWHEAVLTSRTSLFEVAGVHEHEPKILLRDRLKKEAPDLWLIDLGLSESCRKMGKCLIFTRVNSLRGLHMTGGFSFIFDLMDEFALTDGYRREMWSVAASLQERRRTAYFLRWNRNSGIARVHADVVPPERHAE